MTDIVKAVACLTGRTRGELQRALYFGGYLVSDPGDAPIDAGDILTEEDLDDIREKYDHTDVQAETGYRALWGVVDHLDLYLPPRREIDPVALAEALDLPPRILGQLLRNDMCVLLFPESGAGRLLPTAELEAGNRAVPALDVLQVYLYHLIDGLKEQDDAACGYQDDCDTVRLDWPDWSGFCRRRQEARGRNYYRWTSLLELEWLDVNTWYILHQNDIDTVGDLMRTPLVKLAGLDGLGKAEREKLSQGLLRMGLTLGNWPRGWGDPRVADDAAERTWAGENPEKARAYYQCSAERMRKYRSGD